MFQVASVARISGSEGEKRSSLGAKDGRREQAEAATRWLSPAKQGMKNVSLLLIPHTQS